MVITVTDSRLDDGQLAQVGAALAEPLPHMKWGSGPSSSASAGPPAEPDGSRFIATPDTVR
jgi:hypothetical protein